jgi:hypothetical protein
MATAIRITFTNYRRRFRRVTSPKSIQATFK